MAGHSKWANIRHKKAANDIARAKTFMKILAEMKGSIRVGGNNLKENPRLADIFKKAKEANVPKEKIEHCMNPKRDGDMVSAVYEVKGHGQVGFLVEVETNNGKRVLDAIRKVNSKFGGAVASTGAISYAFTRLGRIRLDATNIEEERLVDIALEAGAEDVEFIDKDDIQLDTEEEEENHPHPKGVFDVITTFETYSKVSKVILDDKTLVESVVHGSTGMMWETDTKIEQEEEEMAEKNAALLQQLQELEDTQAVWHNIEC